MDEIATLRDEFRVLLGLVNGLHLLLTAVTRELPPDVAAAAASAAAAGLERAHAGMLGTAITDATVDETVRVVREGIRVLDAATGTVR